MAISLRKQVEKAEAEYRKATDAVYAMAPTQHTPFDGCLRAAAGPVADAYEASKRALWQVEHEAIVKGKAWRSALGHLNWS